MVLPAYFVEYRKQELKFESWTAEHWRQKKFFFLSLLIYWQSDLTNLLVNVLAYVQLVKNCTQKKMV
jgi:hypothetical protein